MEASVLYLNNKRSLRGYSVRQKSCRSHAASVYTAAEQTHVVSISQSITGLCFSLGWISSSHHEQHERRPPSPGARREEFHAALVNPWRNVQTDQLMKKRQETFGLHAFRAICMSRQSEYTAGMSASQRRTLCKYTGCQQMTNDVIQSKQWREKLALVPVTF